MIPAFLSKITPNNSEPIIQKKIKYLKWPCLLESIIYINKKAINFLIFFLKRKLFSGLNILAKKSPFSLSFRIYARCLALCLLRRIKPLDGSYAVNDEDDDDAAPETALSTSPSRFSASESGQQLLFKQQFKQVKARRYSKIKSSVVLLFYWWVSHPRFCPVTPLSFAHKLS